MAAEFEERADQLSLEAIESTLSDGEIFRNARKKLLSKGAKLLVGPRGTGKTHLMRYTYVQTIRDSSKPLALYANFSRYLNLEPLLKRSPDALQKFHSWVVAKIILSAFDRLRDESLDGAIITRRFSFLEEDGLRRLISLLERSAGSDEYERFGRHLTVELALDCIRLTQQAAGRARTVLLLDDAALSLTDQYLVAFFDVYRLLKTDSVSPKASVYPGSTQYGPTFHASHEVEQVSLWLSVEDSDYLTIMGDIASRRFSTSLPSSSSDTLEMLKYIAFGSPRAYLRLVRGYLGEHSGSSQSKVNRIVDEHAELIGAEYDSLGIKLRQFSTVIGVGRKLFDGIVRDLAVSHTEDSRRNIVFGLRQESARSPVSERMLRFLVEVGMLYPLQAVSHGEGRKYDRYIPHLAFLYQAGLFRSGRGSSSKDVVMYMHRPQAKHPLRRDLSSVLSKDDISRIKLDLPPCQNCGAARVSESQRFCHICGFELMASSLFEQSMSLSLRDVPGITSTLYSRIEADTNIRTVGDVYSSQNASADLQQASYVGPVRAQGVMHKVQLAVDEFLS